MASDIRGMREARAAFTALPEVHRELLNDATETTVREIARTAQQRVAAAPSIRTRSLYRAIAWKMNTRTGVGKAGVTSGSTRVRTNQTSTGRTRTVTIRGFIQPGRDGSAQGARLIRPSRYAHLVELGTRHSKAEPFMVPASEAEAPHYLARCRATGPTLARRLAQIGGGRHL